MGRSDEYILSRIHMWVWSGFCTLADANERVEDILDEDTDEALVRSAIRPEFQKKLEAERTWPVTTDCDRLDDAFVDLNAKGIVALHNAGYTMSDGESDVAEQLHVRGRANIRGYCFYHGQDVERAVEGGGLWLAFGDLDDDATKKTAVGELVKEMLTRHGLSVDWNGDPERRLGVPSFDWKRRLGR